MLLMAKLEYLLMVKGEMMQKFIINLLLSRSLLDNFQFSGPCWVFFTNM